MGLPVVLLAEADEALRFRLNGLLLGRGCEVIKASDPDSILRGVVARSVDLVILGSPQPAPRDALEIACEIRHRRRGLPIILLAANSSEELAIAALRTGITDYFKHPCPLEEVAGSVTRCLADALPRPFPAQNRRRAAGPIAEDEMIGRSPVMQRIRAYITQVASSDSNVLIIGEIGTGKELTAELIHRQSPRRQRPLVCVNCAAIPETLLESELFGYEKGAFTGAYARKEGKLKLAEGGTVFFDEIGDMGPHSQAKILRAIEGREVHRLGGKDGIPLDLRIIAATNQDLEQLVAEGKFRKDLYFRLNVTGINLPPLRERKEDIPPLADHYIQDFNRRFGREVEGFTGEALASLLRYEWPGNVRELKNLLEAIFVNLPPRRISLVDLPEQFRRRIHDVELLPRDERDRLLSALFATRWNKSQAAAKLRWSRMTLYRKMAKYQIGKSEGPTRPLRE